MGTTWWRRGIETPRAWWPRRSDFSVISSGPEGEQGGARARPKGLLGIGVGPRLEPVAAGWCPGRVNGCRGEDGIVMFVATSVKISREFFHGLGDEIGSC